MRELKATALQQTYGDKTLLNDVSFLIHEKDRIGLIGTNGTGKSTLLKILSGQLTTEGAGTLERAADYRIAYLAQDAQLPAELTVLDAVLSGKSPLLKILRDYEEIVLKMEQAPLDEKLQATFQKIQEEMTAKDIWQLETRVRGILTQLQVPLSQKKIGELSGGQKKRAALAQALIDEGDLLLLDEPTNHLDIAAITWLENYLQHYQGALLMVTHDRYFLDRVANRIFELDAGNLLEIKGNYQSYLEEKETLNENSALQLEKSKALYKSELEWIRAGVQARGTKQQARINRFNDLKTSIASARTAGDNLVMDMATTRLGKKVLAIKDGNYQIGTQKILKDFEILVQGGDRIGIIGQNGVGKTTLLNILAGKLPLQSGIYEIGETVKLAYYTQQMEEIDPDKRMIQYLQEVAEEVENSNGYKIPVVELLERFLFPRAMHGTLVKKLSGGEKRRLYLLKLLMSQPNVLFLDEPTNDLDIATLTVLEDYLEEFSGSVLAVSHDRYFLDKTMDKLLILEGQGKYAYFYGVMSDYLAKENEKTSAAPVKVKAAPVVAADAKHKVKTKLTYMEQKEWATIEADIEQLEMKVNELTEAMNHQGADFDKLAALQRDLDETQAQLEQTMDRWEYLSEFV